MNPLPAATGLLMNLKYLIFFRKNKKVQMGNEHAKPSDRLKTIDKDIKSLSSSFKGSKNGISKEQQTKIVESLAKYSNEANSLRGKVKDKYVDDIQRNITYIMNEVLTVPNDNLDEGAVETNSIVQMPVTKRHSLPKSSIETPMKKSKSAEFHSNKHSAPTIQDIEAKLKSIKPKIKAAIDNQDTTELRLLQQTIKVLATDLEMIDVIEQTPLGDRKEKLITTVTSQYQKIVKAMKDIRRSKDINYLADQGKKSKIVNELEDIRKSLEGTDLLLTRALKNEDNKAIKSSEESLAKINLRLANAKTVDEETKNLKLHMMDKLVWLEKYLKDATSKGSQSDLTRAQSSYEDLIKTIASGSIRNTEDIKIRLESLHSFVENIKEDEENSLKRKQKLLNHILESVALVNEDEQAKKSTFDNSNDREKISRSKSYIKHIEEVSRMWYSLKKKLKVETIDKEDLNKIDDLLYKLQTSIAATRNSFRKNTSKLQSDLNYSTPNLTSPSLVKKCVSSLSVDVIDEGTSMRNEEKMAVEVIEPQYKMTVEESEPNEQIVIKSHYTENDNFSEIEDIKTQVYYIREKFEESNHKQHLKNKLESYVQILQEFAKSPNQAISNNARLVLSDIHEMLRTMIINYDNPTERRVSIEDNLEYVVAVQENIEELTKIVDNFSGNINDPTYKATKEQLIQNRDYLQSIHISHQYSMINQQKFEILNKIQYLMEVLDKKATNTYQEDSVVAATRKKLNNLKDKINRFSGTYKGVLYNQIEKDLNKILIEAGEKIDNRTQADEIMRDTEKYLKILEHRSSREQSFRNGTKNKYEDEESFTKLKHELINIKNTIDNTPATGVDMFLGLRSRLDLVKLGLDQLKCLKDDDYHQRDFLYNEVETLRNFLEAKIALSQKALQQFPMEDTSLQKVIDKLDRIEDSFRKLVPEIKQFIGTKSDEKFYELDEASIKLILRMDEIDLPNGSDLQRRKLSLLREIYQFGELLDKRASDTETLIQYERDIQDIENNFARYTHSTQDLNKLAEKVKALKNNLENNSLNTILRDRKKKCINRFHEIENRIEKNSHSRTVASVEEEFKALQKEIEQFNGVQADKRYYELDELISGYFTKLDVLDIPENSDLFKKKIQLLKEIQSYSHLLDKKASDNGICKDIRFKLENFKKKLDKFDDTMQNLTIIEMDFKSLESVINRANISQENKDEFLKQYSELTEKIKNIRKRFETTDNFKGVTSFKDSIPKNKNDVATREVLLKNSPKKSQGAVNVFRGQTMDDAEKDDVFLDAIKDEEPNELSKGRYQRVAPIVAQSEVVKVAKEQYSQDLKDARNSSGSSIPPEASKEDNDSNQIESHAVVDDTRKYEDELNKIEAAFRKIVPEIRNFVGTTADNKFNELDDASTNLILKMDDMEFIKGTELYTRKLNLLKEIFKFGDLLDKRAKDTETLLQYESDIKDIESNFEKYIHSKTDLEKLIEKVKVLKMNLNVNSLNTLLRDRRQICFDKINQILKKIESQGTMSHLVINIMEVEKEFKSIMKEIESFSGIHSDKRCQELDVILVKLLSKLESFDLPDESELSTKKTFMLREIENYRKILDKRATETEFYRSIRRKIDANKSKIENFSGNIDELKTLETQLKSIQSAVEEASLKETVRQELKQRIGAVMTKHKIIQKKFRTTKNNTNGNTAKSYKEYLDIKLKELELELEHIQEKVATFGDVEGSEAHQQLEDALRNLSTKIKKLNIPSDNQYYNRKIELKRRTIDCLTKLDERIETIEAIVDIEKDLEMVREKIEDTMTDEVKNNLDEKLITLQVKLSKLHVNEDLIDRKSMCENSAFLYMKKLKDRTPMQSEEENSGTFV